MARTERSDPRDTRRVNRTVVLQLLRKHGRLSGYDLAKRSGLSPTATYDVLEELVRAGVVLNHGTAKSRGGRPPVMYSLNPAAGYVIGADLSGAVAVAESFSLCGDRVRRVESPFDVGRTGSVLSAVLEVIAKAGVGLPGPVIGIGIGVPGLVDPGTGAVVRATQLGWEELPLGQIVSGRFRRPVIVDNDANAAALGETWYGAGRGHANVVYVIADNGVGAGLVLNGRLYRGAFGVTGELGHTVIDSDGVVCGCGRRGCLEALVSVPAIIRRVNEQRGALPAQQATTDFKAVLAAAYSGDPVARRVMQDAGRYLGIALANVVNLLGPTLIVLGGRIAEGGPLLWEPMVAELRRGALPPAASVQVTRSELRGRASVVGAATLVFEQVFSTGHEEWLPGLKRSDDAKAGSPLSEVRSGGDTSARQDECEAAG